MRLGEAPDRLAACLALRAPRSSRPQQSWLLLALSCHPQPYDKRERAAGGSGRHGWAAVGAGGPSCCAAACGQQLQERK